MKPWGICTSPTLNAVVCDDADATVELGDGNDGSAAADAHSGFATTCCRYVSVLVFGGAGDDVLLGGVETGVDLQNAASCERRLAGLPMELSGRLP